MDLAKTPHLLVAGGTGSGKSVGVNTMILSLLYRFAPANLRLILIDPKMLEFAPFKDIPHLLVPPITDSALATNVLAWACKEMDRRYALLAEAGVKNIAEYNERLEGRLDLRVAERQALLDAMRAEAEAVHAEMLEEKGPSLKMVVDDAVEAGEEGVMAVVERTEESVEITEETAPPTPVSLPDNHDLSAENDPEVMPFIVIVVDEFADLMMTAGKDVETHVGRLAQKARAAGMHVILATQRPSVDVVTGVIKVNFPSRIAFRVSAVQDSRTIIERTGAERLLGNGDMLVVPPNSSDPSRVQGAFVSTEELTRILEDVRSKGDPDYDETILANAESDGGVSGPSDEPYDSLWLDCLRIAAAEGHVSTSWLQRRLSIGYTRAGRIVDRMEREGLVGPGRGAKPREVFVTLEQLENPDQPMGQNNNE
jgi:S-DNA-T family DNA segregation ATPase FtsK/SpoIIIE